MSPYALYFHRCEQDLLTPPLFLNFRRSDFVFVRKGMSLERRIDRDGERLGLKCQVHYWRGAWECEKLFGSVMRRVDP